MSVHQPDLFTGSGELPYLDRFERIDLLAQTQGFMPVTKTEQVEVMGLQSFLGKPGGAAKHLAEVAIHQKKAGVEDVGSAGRRITRDYIGYALDAKASTKALAALQEELKEVNPELVLELAVEPEQPGMLEFLRYFDLATLKETGDLYSIGYDPQDPRLKYSVDNPGIMFYLKEAMSKWRVAQVKRRLPEATADQAARFIFFAERLVEITKHGPKQLAAIANEGLDEIYGRSSEDQVK
jgi:hypothetical protein